MCHLKRPHDVLLAAALFGLLFGCTGKVGSNGSPASLTVTTQSLPAGAVGQANASTVQASGGCTPYAWSVSGGALPSGVAAAPSPSTTSYLLAGTPTVAGTDAF